jgi:hypothetical protein
MVDDGGQWASATGNVVPGSAHSPILPYRFARSVELKYRLNWPESAIPCNWLQRAGFEVECAETPGKKAEFNHTRGSIWDQEVAGSNPVTPTDIS